MKKRLMFLGAVLGATVIFSGCGQKVADKAADAEDQAIEQKADAPDQDNDSQSEETSLKDLMAQGKNMECTWTTKDEKGNDVSGTLDISGQKFKMTMMMSNPDKTGTSNSYTLSDGTWTYVWSDMMKGAGMKIKTLDAEKAGKDIQASNPGGAQGNIPASGGPQANWQKDYEYDCDPWEATDSVFAIPSDIDFTDASNIMKGLKDMPDAPNMPIPN